MDHLHRLGGFFLLRWARLLWRRFICKPPSKLRAEPQYFPQDIHLITQRKVSRNALRVLHILNEAGYEAFLVGGAVRDLLLEKQPKDFDVATNAHLFQIKKLFKNSRIIGHRFKLVHVWFYKEVIEISTFRAPPQPAQRALNSEGMLIQDNTYGNLEQDAMRRDFTVNALYYDVSNASLIDYHNGWSDLKQRCLRLIGEPIVRYREDPVRILRALRFAAQHQFTLAPATEAGIPQTVHCLRQVAPARLFEEILKLFLSGYAQHLYPLLSRYRLLPVLFPMLPQPNDILVHPAQLTVNKFLQILCADLDKHHEDAPRAVQIMVLWSGLLWPCFSVLRGQMTASKKTHVDRQARHLLIQKILDTQKQVIALPKRYSHRIASIFEQLQRHLDRYDRGTKSLRGLRLPASTASLLNFFRQSAYTQETHRPSLLKT